MAQEQCDGDQPWELADGDTGDGADESIDFVSDVEFVEEGVDEPTRPLQIVWPPPFPVEQRGGGVVSSVEPRRVRASRCVAVAL